MAARKVTCSGYLKQKGRFFGKKNYFELQGNTLYVIRILTFIM